LKCSSLYLTDPTKPIRSNDSIPSITASGYSTRSRGGPDYRFLLAAPGVWDETNAMKNYTKILLSILVAMMCTVSFAADKPAGCKKSGKNCPMNDNKECNCGKACDCKAPK